MAISTSRILIETIVRKALRDIRETPERNTRNLVDMALNFSKGRFQMKFFKSAQRMLRNEQSAYYRLVHRVVENVDHERLISFGMNIGYNSCTIGAKKIREIEAAEGFNIPWALFLDMDMGTLAQQAGAYDSLIRQGKELGIFTWFIHADTPNHSLFDLLSAHDDCAFVLMCKSKDISEAVIEGASELKHLMLSVETGESAEMVCQRLQEQKMLYAVHMKYDAESMKNILNDNLLYDTQSLNASFTVFIPDANCTDSEKEIVYDYVLRKREEQQFPTLAWEMIQDVLNIDTIISEDSCSGGFLTDGSFFALVSQTQCSEWNLHTAPLKEILKTCFPK